MILNEIIKVLEKKFPVTNKEEWDNVGLMIGRRQNEIKKIQLSLDVTMETIDNAIKNGVDEQKIKKLESLSIDDVAFTLSKNEIKAIEYYFGLGLDKRYSIFEIEQEMKLEKNQGEPLFSMALAKISSRDGRMFSL